MVCLTNEHWNALPTIIPLYVIDALLHLDHVNWDNLLYPPIFKLIQEHKKGNTEIFQKQIPNTHYSHTLSDYVGIYMNDGYGTILLTMKNNILHLKFGEFDTPLIHYHYDSFIFKWEFFNFYFSLSFDTSFYGTIGGLKITFEEKVSPIYFKHLSHLEMKKRE